jgi:dUTP pyrophosphatase
MTMTDTLKIKLLSDNAEAPSYGSAHAAGMDLRACFDGPAVAARIEPGERALIKTGIAVAIPPGHYGRIAPRSGLALKQGVDVLAGVIDEDYRGEIGVILLNTDIENPVMVKHGDRIAQLIIEKISRPVVTVVENLDESDRGAGGFGSTGVA